MDMDKAIMQNLDRQKELSRCTYVKTLLMLSIVFYHSLIFGRGGWNVVGIAPTEKASGLYWLVQWLAACQNYAFALTSGYLFYYVKYERGGYGDYGKFVANKAKRLLIPFLFVGVARHHVIVGYNEVHTANGIDLIHQLVDRSHGIRLQRSGVNQFEICQLGFGDHRIDFRQDFGSRFGA